MGNLIKVQKCRIVEKAAIVKNLVLLLLKNFSKSNYQRGKTTVNGFFGKGFSGSEPNYSNSGSYNRDPISITIVSSQKIIFICIF